MAQSQITAKKQQGNSLRGMPEHLLTFILELQQQYTNYKNNLQQLAQRVGDVEQDTEEHKYADLDSTVPTTVAPRPQYVRFA